MSLADRLDALRARKREQQETLLAAVRAGAIPGVTVGAEAIPPRRVVDDPHAESLAKLFPNLRYDTRGESRVARIESHVAADAESSTCAYRLPMPMLPFLDDVDRLRAIHPDLGERFDPERIAFLDVESTGVSGGTGTVAFLVGVGRIERGSNGAAFRVEQFLIEDFRHETAMLDALQERLASCDAFCTYNGKAFDVPLLRTRFAMERRGTSLWDRPNLDLLFFSRRLWRGALPNVRLSTVEREVFGLHRETEIDGAEIPSVWLDFARTGRPGRLALVAHRNAQDVVTLASLLALHVRCAGAAADPQLLKRASECFGIGRWHESRKEWKDARLLIERALQIGAPDAGAEDAWLLRLANLHRRAGDFASAVETWKQLRARPLRTSMQATVELAKHLERRERDFAAAALMVHDTLRRVELEREVRLVTGRSLADLPGERTLEDLRRRLERLEKKGRGTRD